MKRYILSIALLCAPAAFGQGYRYDNFVQKPLAAGGVTPVSGALITVCTSAGTGTPCTPKVANIYSNEALSSAITGTGGTGTTNSDANGNFGFYITPGDYVITVTGSGITSYTINVTLPFSLTTAIDVGKENSIFWAGSTLYPTCQSAITAAGTVNKSIVMIRSDYAAAACPATVPENITLVSYDGTDRCNVLNSTPPCSNVLFNNDDTVVYAAEKHEMTTSHQDLNGVTLPFYVVATLMNATANGSSGIDGVSQEANTGGTLSGTFAALQPLEADSTLRSTGGTITNNGSVFYFNSTAGSTTAVTNVFGAKFLGCNQVLGAVPTNCYGAFFSRQDTAGVGKASGRNYSFFSEGPALFGYLSSTGFGGIDLENTAHTAIHALFVDSSNHLNVQAVDATGGLQLMSSDGTVRGKVTSSGFTVSTALLPNATGVDIGSTALPFQNLWLGTAATNNFKFQPAATAAARIITIADPLSPSTVGLPLTIASGTTTLTANAALAAVTSQAANTTAATGVLATDAIEWSFASAPTAGDNLCHVLPYVTAGNVNFVRTNPTAAAQNVSALVINWRVIR